MGVMSGSYLASVCVLICEGSGSVCSIWYAYVRTAVSGTATPTLPRFSPAKSRNKIETHGKHFVKTITCTERKFPSLGVLYRSLPRGVWTFRMAKMQYLVRAVRNLEDILFTSKVHVIAF